MRIIGVCFAGMHLTHLGEDRDWEVPQSTRSHQLSNGLLRSRREIETLAPSEGPQG